MSRGNPDRPWAALHSADGLHYPTELDYAFRDRVIALGCDHHALALNGALVWQVCDKCRPDAMELCVDHMGRLVEAFAT